MYLLLKINPKTIYKAFFSQYTNKSREGSGINRENNSNKKNKSKKSSGINKNNNNKNKNN